MKISVIGTGYVGLVTGACLADVGNEVLCVDIDESKINRLRSGEIPIYEPGLDQIVSRNIAAGRLRFTSSPEDGARFGLVQMIAVGTPPGEDGSADLSYVLAAARNIARYAIDDVIIVDKSTVPVGTADRVAAVVREELAARGNPVWFAVVSNPEFLKEGAAIEDFSKPDRIVLGVEDARAEAIMRELYEPFQRNKDRTLVMSLRSAELTKYAANAMLATRISFMNELSNLAEQMNADIEDVRRGIGSDPRIGSSFLYAGTGFGGSCFPKDVKALSRTATENGITLQVLNAVEAANDRQKQVLVDKARKHYGGALKGKHFAIWGLAFKPDTDDMREAPSLTIIEQLLAEGATIAAFDPVAIDEARKVLGERPGLSFGTDQRAVVDGADALIIVTEWKQFRSPDFAELAERMRARVIFDGRNLYDPRRMAERGFTYHSIGRVTRTPA